MYEVRWPNKERWIFIFCDYPGELDAIAEALPQAMAVYKKEQMFTYS